MAQPTPYDRQFNFQDQQAQTPTSPLPADEVDNEFNAVKVTLDQTLSNLAKIQRDDGALKNGIVTQDSLSDSLSIGFTLRGDWASGVNYLESDGVGFGSSFYKATTSHLSSAGNAPDQPDAPWTKLVDFTALSADAAASAAAAAASATAASDSATSASNSATAAAGSATAAADDRVQTGLDSATTTANVSATAADRVQTGLDAAATAADRVQTGSDRDAASASAALAAQYAEVLQFPDYGSFSVAPTEFGDYGDFSS